MNFKNACNYVFSKKKIINPNHGFIEQSIEFQEMRIN